MKFVRKWSSRSVMDICIKCNWYTSGTSKEYDDLLDFVDTHKPTDRNISKVAKNILLHSKEDGREITSIAWCLAHEAVRLVLIEE